MDINLRGYLCNNDDADVLRWMGWRDITAPMDIAAVLDAAAGEPVTLLINSPGGSMPVGVEIASLLRRYGGKTEALFQGMGASAATMAATGCQRILAEPGAVLCYHCPSMGVDGDWQAHQKATDELRNLRESAINVYMTRTSKSREEIGALLDADKVISAQQAMEYGLVDEVVGLADLEPMPLNLVASAGWYPHITPQMRSDYQGYMSGQTLATKQARCARAQLEALAEY